MPTRRTHPASLARAAHPSHAALSTRHRGRPAASLLASTTLLCLLLVVAACDSPVGIDEGEEDEVEITEGVSADLPVDSGEVGVVLDIRKVFRKGYIATEAKVTFSDYPSFDTTLSIDPVTNFAVVSIPNEDLTEAQKTAFTQDGVATDIVIYDDTQVVLSNYQDNELKMDDSNRSIIFRTDLEHIHPPMDLREDIPYLLQKKNTEGVVTVLGGWRVKELGLDNSEQQFYFLPVENSPNTNTFQVQHTSSPEKGTFWYIRDSFDGLRVDLGGGTNDLPPDGPGEFVLEPDDDGWFRIRVAGTNRYLSLPDYCKEDGVSINSCALFADSDHTDRFRIITDNIDWDVVDRGTVFNEPVKPPARLDFAVAQTIKNCSPATVTQTVGQATSRSRSVTMETTESVQLFAGVEVTVGMKTIGEIGADVKRVGEVKGTVERAWSLTVTASATVARENTYSEEVEETSEVSQSRQVEVPPFSAVEVYDAVRTIDNVRIPLTQTLRVRASYKKDGSALSGNEILSQLLFNFVEGVPSEIGPDYVDVSIRGFFNLDQMFETETNVNELPGVCD